MKVIGLVQWTDRDKRGSPIAGVRPLVELTKDELRSINAAEEFPSQGQVFWPNAQSANENALVVFRAEPNPGHKDEFRVAEPRPAYEVLDLRRYGTEGDVRNALLDGVEVPGPVGNFRALIWCKPDTLLGPVELKRVADGKARLVSNNLHRLATYHEAHVRPVLSDPLELERLVRIDDAGPSGYVDWDDNATVLHRALEIAIRVAKKAEQDASQTKRQIKDAALALAKQVGAEPELDHYRLERALRLLENTEAVAWNAAVLVDHLQKHPALKVHLDLIEANLRTEVQQRAREELHDQLETELNSLKELTDECARAKRDLETGKNDLRMIQGEIANARSDFARVAEQAEAAVDARLRTALERPLDLLAEVSVLRPFLNADSASGSVASAPYPRSSKIDWSHRRGKETKDKTALRRVLTDAARVRGVDPAAMLQLHAAVVARLTVITLGHGSLAALASYADAVCAGRMFIIHVSPGAIAPQDLYETSEGGLLAAASAATNIDGLSLVVLEGANRAPLEGSLVPILQLTGLQMSHLATAGGLRLAASLVSGATTVPVTPDLWSHAAAVYAHCVPPLSSTNGLSELSLSSELLAPGDEPTSVIEDLLDAWPDCDEIRPTMSRFGAALARLYDDEQRIRDAILRGLVLPYVTTALSLDEQARAVEEAGDSDGDVLKGLRLLRRYLA